MGSAHIAAMLSLSHCHQGHHSYDNHQGQDGHHGQEGHHGQDKDRGQGQTNIFFKAIVINFSDKPYQGSSQKRNSFFYL